MTNEYWKLITYCVFPDGKRMIVHSDRYNSKREAQEEHHYQKTKSGYPTKVTTHSELSLWRRIEQEELK